jgi:hypothetical protein
MEGLLESCDRKRCSTLRTKKASHVSVKQAIGSEAPMLLCWVEYCLMWVGIETAPNLDGGGEMILIKMETQVVAGQIRKQYESSEKECIQGEADAHWSKPHGKSRDLMALYIHDHSGKMFVGWGSCVNVVVEQRMRSAELLPTSWNFLYILHILHVAEFFLHFWGNQ